MLRADMNQLSRSFLHLCLAIFGIMTVSCSSPLERRTTYPDGFRVLTVSPGPVHLRSEGSTKTYKADTINGLKADHSKTTILKKHVRRIPNRLRDGFGIMALILGLPDGKNSLVLEIDHPPFQIPEKGLQTHFTRVESMESKNAKALWDYSYIFDHGYEQTPGVWSFRLNYRDRVIFSESLTVVASAEP